MKAALIVALVASTALAGAAHAVDVYKWKDSKGVVHYGDRPASGAAASLVSARDDKVDPDDTERARQRVSDVQDGTRDEESEDESDEPRHAASRRPAPTGCAAAWQRYDAAQACFGANRAAGGKGVSTNGAAVCKEVAQPSCAR